MTYLIIGNCGSGKTFVMKQLINALNVKEVGQAGLYHMVRNVDKKVIILGKYDGSMFEGSDRLAMNIMASNNIILPLITGYTVLAEGDRFTNSTFIRDFKPVILRILGTGEAGRAVRESTQTERHLKSIATRVKNIQADYEFDSSGHCFEWLLKTLLEPTKNHYARQAPKQIKQVNLF